MAVNTETIEHGCERVVLHWVMHGIFTKWSLTPSLSRFKKAPLFFAWSRSQPYLLRCREIFIGIASGKAA